MIGIQCTKACQLALPKASQDSAASPIAAAAATSDGQPAPVRDQHKRKQQTELRLVGQQPETNAGKRRPPLQQSERAADQRRGEEAVLPGGDVPQRGGKAERNENAGAAENAAMRRDISGERRQQRNDRRDQKRQRRQRRGDEQKRRRIVPAVIVGKIVADDADFGLLVRRPVVGGGRLAVEREPSRRDDIDEIVGDRPALRDRSKNRP